MKITSYFKGMTKSFLLPKKGIFNRQWQVALLASEPQSEESSEFCLILKNFDDRVNQLKKRGFLQ